MATLRTVYVDPDVSGGAGNGTSWANAYSSLNAAEQAQDDTGDLVSRDEYIEFHCGHNGSAQTTADGTGADLAGWTTDATRHITVLTESADRHTGRWCDGNNGTTARYRLLATSSVGQGVLQVSEEFVRVTGLQIGKSSSSDNGQHVLVIASANGSPSDYQVSSCLVKGAGGTTYAENGVWMGSANNTVKLWNSIIYGIAIKTASGAEAVRVSNVGALSLYSCTILGGYRGVRVDAGTVTAKNCYVGNTASEDWYFAGGTLAKTTCASEDTSADDAGGNESQSNCVNSVAHSTSTFTNVTAGQEDYSLVVGSGLIGVGTDTSGDSAPLNFTVDIIGTTRS